MKLRELVVADAVVPRLNAKDRDGTIRELVTALAMAGAIDPADVPEVTASVLKREKGGSTGFGKGVAVPHTKHGKITKVAAAVGLSQAGIDFSALDKQPVYSVVLIVSPEGSTQHLQAMDIIFRQLQRDIFRRFLRQADTREKVLDLLDEADSGK